MLEESQINKLFMEFEVLEMEVPSDGNFNRRCFYPYSGVFLIPMPEGSYTIVNVGKGNDENIDYCPQFQQIYIGGARTMPSDRVLDIEVYDEKVSSIESSCEERIKIFSEKIMSDYKQKEKDLEHEYEMKKMQLELETPKRFEQGEWISGVTLQNILKIVVGKESEK